MKNLENYGVTEMNAKEMKRTDGGWTILRISGWFDGQKGSEGFLFGWKIWDTYPQSYSTRPTLETLS